MPWWKNPDSVRSPLIVIIGIILVSGFLLTSGLSYQVSKNSLRQALIDNELPLTSDSIYSEIQRDLLQPVFVSSLMANDIFVRDWLLDGEKDTDRITRYLEEIRRKYGLFTSFLISDKTRNYYHFNGVAQVVSENDPEDVWYFRVRDMDKPYELNVDFNQAQNNATTIFINYKIYGYDKKFLAVVGVGLEFDSVAKIVSRYRERFGRNIYFIDDQGNITIRSDGAIITESNIHTAPGTSNFADAIMSEKQGSFEYERNGEAILLSTRYIPELNWHVIVEQQESVALEAIRQGLISNTLIGLSVIALTIFLIIYVINIFHSRLEAMLSEAKTAHIQMKDQATEMATLAENEATLANQLKYEIDVKNRFFSVIAHDLKNPFTALLGMTRMMSEKKGLLKKDRLIEYARDVNIAGERVFDLLENLLEWSRLQMSGVKLSPQMISLQEIAQDCVDVLAPMAHAKNIQLSNEVRSSVAFADRDMVQSVIRNLVSNALKFTPAGGTVKIASQQQNDAVQITVSDTGVGVSKEQTTKLFSLDQTVSTTGTVGEMGTGLGLPLCKDMVERNRGSIWVESTAGTGSQFHFTLPIEPAA